LALILNGIFVACLPFAIAAERIDCGQNAVCERARAALDAAQDAVQAASQQRALWTTAQNALVEARIAFGQERYEAAASAAAIAEQLAKLGIAQRREPPFPQPGAQ